METLLIILVALSIMVALFYVGWSYASARTRSA